ncbi:Hypothetical predicted protein [Mytilus galloprovincialis]|uniref:Chitin synthase n=1 Tax=Mytilus galloprovincialis TaxID=29158 RepID=A0A8B6D7N7_MYTGA|nr:Hypothetical predicted protein [Mytilus galloprovincialis]
MVKPSMKSKRMIPSLGKRQSENKVNTDDTNIANIFSLQAHVFFDDAFIEKEDAEDAEEHPKINHYVETFIKMVKKAAEELLGENYTDDYVKKLTPYGSRLEWTLPCNNKLHVHLNDTNKIRYKKRWSQVMYMSYILKYQYKQPHLKISAENIYILALDGDVKFEPEAVLSLMRRLKKSKKIGAACGRIHPMGTGIQFKYK